MAARRRCRRGTQRADRPDPAQWFYVQTIENDPGQGRTKSENWITFDGRRSAYYEGNHLVVHDGHAAVQNNVRGTPLDVWDDMATPLTAYDALASLPPDPEKLINVVDRQLSAQGLKARMPGGVFGGAPNPTRAQEEFAYLANLLWNADLTSPPAAVAAVYRAMASIPGITAQDGIANVAGTPAVGLAADNGRSQLLLDPHTFQVIGLRLLSPGPSLIPPTDRPGYKPRRETRLPLPLKGTVTQSLAHTYVTRVTGPGRHLGGRGHR